MIATRLALDAANGGFQSYDLFRPVSSERGVIRISDFSFPPRPVQNCSNIRKVARSHNTSGPPYKARLKSAGEIARESCEWTRTSFPDEALVGR